MDSKTTLDQIKLFSLANSLTEKELDVLEEDLEIDLGREDKKEVVQKSFYLQFELEFRKEAKSMSEHYEVFYCLEKSIRKLIRGVVIFFQYKRMTVEFSK